jgi:hypothetical protein
MICIRRRVPSSPATEAGLNFQVDQVALLLLEAQVPSLAIGWRTVGPLTSLPWEAEYRRKDIHGPSSIGCGQIYLPIRTWNVMGIWRIWIPGRGAWGAGAGTPAERFRFESDRIHPLDAVAIWAHSDKAANGFVALQLSSIAVRSLSRVSAFVSNRGV